MSVDSLNKAIGYLMANENEIPDGLKDVFTELKKYHAIDSGLVKAYEEAKETLNEIRENMMKNFGAADAIMSIIGSKLTKEEVEQYSHKFSSIKEAANEKSDN